MRGRHQNTSTKGTPIVGIVREHKNTWYVEPLTPDYKDYLPVPRAEQHLKFSVNDVVRATIPRHAYKLDFVIVEAIVDTKNEVERAIKAMLLAHQVPNDDWTTIVPDHHPTLDKSEIQQRRDLRKLPFVTIDGESAKDFDDAIYARKGKQGGWILYVAIADVAHYVPVDSPIDVEAQRRGNSVYLPDFVVPMLPEALSNGICSLNPSEDRLVVACEMKIDSSGKIRKYEFYDAVIHSVGRLTYTEAQRITTGWLPARSNAINNSLTAFYALYQSRRQHREERGALDFSFHEAYIKVVDGNPFQVCVHQQNDAHRMIEEAMIAANICAARYLHEHGLNPMYRIHDKPDNDSISTLQQVLTQNKLQYDKKITNSPKAFQTVLEHLRHSLDPSWIWEFQVLRALTQAQYSFDNRGHFGLALTDYAHFTSPIRRYSDLYVHRQMKSTFKQESHSREPVSTALTELALVLSKRERRAEIVSRRVDGWLKCVLLKKHVGKSFWGYVVSVEDFGLFVELDDYYIAGLIHISDLGNEYFTHQGSVLRGEASNKTYRLGERLNVVVVNVDVEGKKIDLLESERFSAMKQSER